MDLTTLLSTFWGPLTAVGGFVIGGYLLKQRSEDHENRISALEVKILEWREEMRQEVQDVSTRSDVRLQDYIEMEKDEHKIIIAKFEGSIDRLAQRVDANHDKLADKIDKLVDYNLSRKQ